MVQEERKSSFLWGMKSIPFFRYKVDGTKTLAQVFYLHFCRLFRRTKIIQVSKLRIKGKTW